MDALAIEIVTIDRGIYAKSILEGFNKLRQESVLTDVVFIVGKTRFPAHRALLAADNEYFYTMFVSDMAEKEKKEIVIKGIQAEIMEIMLNFFYTASVTLNTKNVIAILAASSLFMVESLSKVCSRYLSKRLSKVNCAVIYGVADTYSQPALKAEASELIRRYFLDISKSSEFLALSAAQVADIIACDGLHVASEIQVFQAVIDWVHCKPEERQRYLSLLLSRIRLSLIDEDYLTNSVLPACLNDSECCAQVNSAINQKAPVALPRKTWEILVAVGRAHKTLSTRCWIKEGFDLSPVGEWTKGPTVPETVKHLNVEDVAVVGEKVYVAGSHLVIYNVEKKDWTIGPEFDDGRNRILAAVDDCLYMTIGEYNLFTSRSRSYLHKFDTVNMKWIKLTTIKARIVATAVIDGVLHLIGEIRDNSYRYCPADNTVKNVTWNNTVRATNASIMFQGKLFMVGGQMVTEMAKSVNLFDPVSNQWTASKEMCKLRYDASLLVCGGKLYVANGNAYSDDIMNHLIIEEDCFRSVEVYDPVTQSWSVCGMVEIRDAVDEYDARENVWIVSVPNRLHSLERLDVGDHVQPGEEPRGEESREKEGAQTPNGARDENNVETVLSL